MALSFLVGDLTVFFCYPKDDAAAAILFSYLFFLQEKKTRIVCAFEFFPAASVLCSQEQGVSLSGLAVQNMQKRREAASFIFSCHCSISADEDGHIFLFRPFLMYGSQFDGWGFDCFFCCRELATVILF